jgi:hypothetical protein
MLRGDTAKNAVAVSAIGDTANDVPVSVIGDTANEETYVLASVSDTASKQSDPRNDAVSPEPINAPMLYQQTPLAVSLDPENPTCCINAISAEPSNPLAVLETQSEILEVPRRREVMKSKRKTEGRAASDASAVMTLSVSQRNVVTDYMRRMPGLKDIHVATRFQLPTEQVRQLREIMGLSTTT